MHRLLIFQYGMYVNEPLHEQCTVQTGCRWSKRCFKYLNVLIALVVLYY